MSLRPCAASSASAHDPSLVTHDIRIAETADRIVHMLDGRIDRIGRDARRCSTPETPAPTG